MSLLPGRQVRPEVHKAGQVLHTVGYPLDHDVYGGSFLYHMSENRIALGCAQPGIGSAVHASKQYAPRSWQPLGFPWDRP